MNKLLNKRFNNQNIILSILILLFCIFFSISNSLFSNDLDPALVIAGKINIPDSNSPQLKIFNESLTLIIYFQALLIKIGLTNYFISNITIIISTLCFFIGIFLITKNLLILFFNYLPNSIAFLYTCLIFFSDTHLPHTDYPNAYFGSFTTGIYSIGLTTLIFGLLISGKSTLVIFFSILLFLIHPVQGLWILGLLILLLIINNIFIKKIYSKKIIYFIIFILLIFLALPIIILFFYSGLNNPNINNHLIEIWLLNWEGHRNNVDINYNYLRITAILLFLSIFCFLIYKKKNIEKIYNFYLLIFLTTLISSLVYIGYKLFFDYLPLFIIVPMPTRIINTHAMIGYPVILLSSLIIINFICEHFNINKKLLLSAYVLIILGSYTLNHQYINFSTRLESIYKNRFKSTYSKFLENIKISDTDFYDQKFWGDVKKLDNKFYTIVSRGSENLSYRYGHKPYLIKVTSFDYVLYRPDTINKTVVLLQEIYGIKFTKEKEYLREENIKKEFESKSKIDWMNIKQKFNAKYVIVPENWKINLKVILQNEKFKTYIIQ